MTRIDSKKVQVPAGVQNVYDHLNDLNNLYDLLPQDRVKEWKADKDHCSFKIEGVSSLELHKEEEHPPNRIILRSGGKAPFEFTLTLHLEEKGDQECEGFLECQAELNAFLKPMVEKPLRNLFDSMADRLVSIKSENGSA